jgi:dUTP pyrophosphatase
MFIHNNLLQYYPKYMHLRLYADGSELYTKYYEAIYNHNLKLNNNPNHIDAGFDLFSPYPEFVCISENVNKLDLKVKCSAQIVERDANGQIRSYNTGYYMHPRSSISKTPLRLANSTGIVDSGYRGNLIGMMDCIRPHYTVERFDRLIQICAPGLIPIFVELVDKVEDLGAETIRGERGIGSSGR